MEENCTTSRTDGVPDDTLVVDHTSAFTTQQLFATRDELLEWVRFVGKSLGIKIIISKSDNGQKSGKEFCMLACEKRGSYKYVKLVPRKCCCKFRLKGKFTKKLGGWVLKVMCGTHNHAISTYSESNPYTSKLTTEEKEVVAIMTKNWIPPNRILDVIKELNPNSHATVAQIYNARSRVQSSLRQGRTELQHLMNRLECDHYVHWHRVAHDNAIVTDIFWAHPDSIELLNTFNIVLLIDSTYKANQYKFPLVEIVGVTSTEKTFSVAFAYVEGEKLDNFAWVLEKLKGLFRRQDALPQVIVTDTSIAMMDAVDTVFPTSSNLLCQFHIKKNVRAKYKLYMHPMDRVEDVMDAFQKVVHATTMDEYEKELQNFENVSAPFDNLISYVKNTWLTPHKERFVDAWIDRHMHLGNTTTNRVESAHSQLKRLLHDSKGDLCNCWDGVNNMLRQQHIDLKMSFEDSLRSVKFDHTRPVYNNLKGMVSANAIDYIAKELKRCNTIGVDSSKCGCTIRTTHGLPCACELARYMMDFIPIPLATIHVHWKRLNFKIPHEASEQPSENPNDDLSLKTEFDALQRRFEVSDHAGRVMLKEKLQKLAFSGW